MRVITYVVLWRRTAPHRSSVWIDGAGWWVGCRVVRYSCCAESLGRLRVARVSTTPTELFVLFSSLYVLLSNYAVSVLSQYSGGESTGRTKAKIKHAVATERTYSSPSEREREALVNIIILLRAFFQSGCLINTLKYPGVQDRVLRMHAVMIVLTKTTSTPTRWCRFSRACGANTPTRYVHIACPKLVLRVEEAARDTVSHDRMKISK